MKKENKLQIRNSTAEFLILTRQAGEDFNALGSWREVIPGFVKDTVALGIFGE